MFKLYSPWKYVPCDSTHLAQRSFHCWKNREKSLFAIAIRAVVAFLLISSVSWKLVPFSGIFSWWNSQKSQGAMSGEYTGSAEFVWCYAWPKTPMHEIGWVGWVLSWWSCQSCDTYNFGLLRRTASRIDDCVDDCHGHSNLILFPWWFYVDLPSRGSELSRQFLGFCWSRTRQTACHSRLNLNRSLSVPAKA